MLWRQSWLLPVVALQLAFSRNRTGFLFGKRNAQIALTCSFELMFILLGHKTDPILRTVLMKLGLPDTAITLYAENT